MALKVTLGTPANINIISIDGGNSNSIYLINQVIDGGNSN
jgi:hypothetical protein